MDEKGFPHIFAGDIGDFCIIESGSNICVPADVIGIGAHSLHGHNLTKKMIMSPLVWQFAYYIDKRQRTEAYGMQ